MKLSKYQRSYMRRLRGQARGSESGFWMMLLVQVALFVLADLLRPKPDLENAKPSGLGDFRFPTATEQRLIPLIWGTVRIEGPNVMWWGDLIQDAITQKVKTGLFSSEKQVIGFRYFIGIQSALCMGPIQDMTQVWIGDDVVLSETALRAFGVGAGGTGYEEGDKLTIVGGAGTAASVRVTKVESITGAVRRVKPRKNGDYTTLPASPASTTGGSGTSCTITFESGLVLPDGTYTIDEPDLFGGEDLGQGGIVGTLKLHAGEPLQAVSTYLAQFQKEPPVTGNTPAYRDICYTAPNADPVLVGTSTSMKAWKWEVRRFPNGLALTGGDHIVVGGANLMNVLYEVLTSSDWGYGIDAADIDVPNFVTAAETLVTEGQGFSFILDRKEDASNMIRRLEQQGEFVLFENPLTAKWQVKLVRADYDILLVPEMNGTNVLDVPTFTRSTWESTSNQVHVPFNQANDQYKGTYGFAQDMANVRILGANITVEVSHPGIKDAALANSIAWRDLRTLAIPLAQGKWIVDRTFFGVLPGDVVAFTNADVGFVRLPIRIKSVNYGDLLEGRIAIEGVQDVFFAAAGSFGDPPGSGWEPPSDTLVAIPVAEQIAFEAPRALTARDPESSDPTTDKVFAAARRQGPEVSFRMVERHAGGTPTGGFAEIGEVWQFQLIGELVSALNLSGTNPLTSVLVDATPDTQAALINAFPDVVNVTDLGTDLVSLCLIDSEFILVQSAQTSGGDVQLNSVYRGVLDSVQEDHLAGAEVYLLFVGAGMSDSSLPAGDNVHVKLLPRSISDDLDEADATQIEFTMSDRTRRPYPPSSFDIEGTTLDTTGVDLDGSGSGEDVGMLIDAVIRRDFRTLEEIQPLSIDAAVLDGSFPAENGTTIEARILDVPGGAVLASETGVTGTTFAVLRKLDILAALGTTTLPASLTAAVRQSHTFESTVYPSLVDLVLTFTIVDPLIGEFAWGVLDDGDISPIYDVQSGDDSTDHDFTLSTAFTSGDVEYRLDGGSFLQLIAAGMTTGTIPNAGLSVGTDIEIRHLSPDTTPQKLLVMDVGGAERAYAVLIS